ncbi:hypothetical protein BaRGS_00039494 [Batillaria attramentaria]|uniref:Uncharacterized protein n=1 Tax=Batillaria attramentaria TaxID=370345 RepID=A0ABD0J396_9CAEN
MEQLDISGTLTCKFEMDLGQLKHDFSVQHYSPEDDVIPDPVLRCIFRKDSEHPECEVEIGYVFEQNTLSNVITLEIPHLQTVHQGWYVCQVIPAIKEDDDTKPCNGISLSLSMFLFKYQTG